MASNGETGTREVRVPGGIGVAALSKVRIYPDEARLLRELGVPTLPEVRLGKARIEIALCPAPAHFWKFRVWDVEGKYHEVETGSGRLTTYWPSVVLIAEGLLGICRGEAQATAPKIPAFDQAVFDAMESRGGGFVSRLAAAWRRADLDNHARMYAAFGHYYDQYKADWVDRRRASGGAA